MQHWWHPPLGRGVRTECSDDYLWLAVATSRYVAITGDRSVLDERVGYIEGRAVHVGEDSYYDLPGNFAAGRNALRALRSRDRAWNDEGRSRAPVDRQWRLDDGMNLVGAQGRGESVWLGFFLYDVLLKFADTALMHGDAGFATRCRSQAVLLRDHLELHGWDCDWYRRAYFDDGTPLGSAANDECKIDSIAQSWSVLSGAGSADRQREQWRRSIVIW